MTKKVKPGDAIIILNLAEKLINSRKEKLVTAEKSLLIVSTQKLKGGVATKSLAQEKTIYLHNKFYLMMRVNLDMFIVYSKFKHMKGACVRLKRLSESDNLNRSTISENMPHEL